MCLEPELTIKSSNMEGPYNSRELKVVSLTFKIKRILTNL
jgi:hypothetical protein